MVSEPRKQSMAWMEMDYSKDTHFQWKIKWWLKVLGALWIIGEIMKVSTQLREIYWYSFWLKILFFRTFLSDRDSFQIAVPIRLAVQYRKKASVKILLRCTNCNVARKEVEWRKLALCEIDPSWLDQVKWVEKFFLSSNLLTSIPNNIGDLRRLCRLDLRKNQLTSVPAELLQMPCLKDLNLSENRIVWLPKKCVWTACLRTLNLSDNLLETLPKSMASAQLGSLYLARNNLYEVPWCVCELISLETLDLSGNPRLTSLPIQMGKLTKVATLKLENLEQVGPGWA